MTKEQAQNLKIGDKIKLAEPLTVIDPKGVSEKILAQTQEGHLVFVEPHETQLADPSPKYDPCRLFRVGDKVKRKKTLNGRDLSIVAPELSFEKEYIITADEHRAKVEINDCGVIHWMSFAMFDLVTPVEEMRPYSVRECKCSKSVEVRRDNSGRVCAVYYYGGECPAYTEAAAKAAAEAERDRLNAEYRKEQE